MNKYEVVDEKVFAFFKHLETWNGVTLFVDKDSGRLNKEGMKLVRSIEKGLDINDLLWVSGE